MMKKPLWTSDSNSRQKVEKGMDICKADNYQIKTTTYAHVHTLGTRGWLLNV